MRSEFYRRPDTIAEANGSINERFVFGEVRTGDPEYQKAKEALVQKYRAMRKPVSPGEAVELIKRFQPLHPDTRKSVDPEAPLKQFPSAVRSYIADTLRRTHGVNVRVFFWTAVGSLVDTGVVSGKEADAVFEIVEEGRSPKFIFADVTGKGKEQRTEKMRKEALQDDMVVMRGEVPDVHEDKAAFDAYVADAGDRIIEKFESARLAPIHGARR